MLIMIFKVIFFLGIYVYLLSCCRAMRSVKSDRRNHNPQKTKDMKYDIQPRKGLGDLAFGMPVEEIVRLIGNASEVESIENAADEPTTVLHYEEGMTIFCEGENPTLTCIDITNEDCTLFGKQIFDMNEREIVRLMVDNQYFEQDADNEDWGERRIGFPEGNIDFFFEDDELMSVIIGK